MRAILLVIIFATLLTSCKTEQSNPTSYKGKVELPQTQPLTQEKIDVKDAVMGEIIYVPVYSHIYFRNESGTINLTATLSIRNTEFISPIIITSVSYYDSDGKLVRHYLTQPLEIPPMASKEYIVEEEDITGGVGANFIVEWSAKAIVSEPVVEAVMVTARSSQGISFVSSGRVIKKWSKETLNNK